MNEELIKALMVSQWYLDSCGENVMARNIRMRVFGFDPMKEFKITNRAMIQESDIKELKEKSK